MQSKSIIFNNENTIRDGAISPIESINNVPTSNIFANNISSNVISNNSLGMFSKNDKDKT